MAAMDPSADPMDDKKPMRATLKLLRRPFDSDSEDEDDKKAGTSKERKGKATAKKGEEDVMESHSKSSSDEDDDEPNDDDSDDESEFQTEEFVICTLDPERNYQQALDITIGEDENTFFKVVGNYNISLSGNYLMPIDEMNPEGDYSDDDSDYDLSPDEDELMELMHHPDSEDELDHIENPRIVHISSGNEDEGEQGQKRKGPEKSKTSQKAEKDFVEKKSLKRPAEDNDEKKVESKLSKKQLKKLKANDGKQIPITADSPQSKKKVQFTKELEQGQSPKDQKQPTEKQSSGSANKKVIQGITIEDKKTGSGPVANKGSKLSMRYIGKLKDGKVFDSNTKGKPFTFCLGNGEVIKGWDIGLLGMKVGGERRITIPPPMAYGKKGTAGIPGHSTLVFDVKLLEVK